MQAISSTNASYALPKKFGDPVVDALPNFPTVIAQLVRSYVVDLSQAKLSLIFNARYQITNLETYEAIKYALVSSDCDRAIVQAIFAHYKKSDRGRDRVTAIFTMTAIFREFALRKYAAELQDLELNNQTFHNFEFPDMIARRSKFRKISFQYCDLTRVDFSDAIFDSVEFIRTKMRCANLIGARFSEVSFDHVDVGGMRGDLAMFRKGTKWVKDGEEWKNLLTCKITDGASALRIAPFMLSEGAQRCQIQ